MKTERIDEYVCIDVEELVREEMRDVISECESDDVRDAATVILFYYSPRKDIQPTPEHLRDPYVLQLIETISRLEDRIEDAAEEIEELKRWKFDAIYRRKVSLRVEADDE